ncbi:MAG TPA: EAL domain-containing protein [Burkholderiaceae bacterium]|jgi:diguanylate cyclase (GGDEF)-like protein/PAS domain S-box-containing protein
MVLLKPSYLLLVALLAITYTLFGKYSLLFAVPPGNACAVWPAAGLAVASCFIYGYRVWPGILIGATVVNATTAVSPSVALIIGIGNTLEALITAWLIKRHAKIDGKFCYSTDVFKFVQYALIGALTSSLIGPTAMLAGGELTADEYSRNWVTWFLGDWTGITIAAPAIITWRSSARRHWTPLKSMEMASFALLFGACAVFVLTVNHAPLFYLFLPLIIWLAFRFTQSEVTKAIFLLAVTTVWATKTGGGPLAGLPFSSALLLLQVFVSVIGITGLALAVTVDERARTEQSLRKLHEELESCVTRRTEQLKVAIDKLRQDIIVREKMQQELQIKEKQLEEAQHLAHLGSWNWDILSDQLTISAEMARIYGVPPNEISLLNYDKYLDYIPPEERWLVHQVVGTGLATKESFRYEHGVIRPDGIRRELRCRGAIEVDTVGTPIRMYGTAHDITEEKVLEKNLLEAEELYRKLVELSPDAIYLLYDNRCAFSNSAGLTLVGAKKAEQVLERSFLEFISHNSKVLVADTLQQVEQIENVISFEGKIVQLDGAAIDVELSGISCNIKDKRGILLVARDISERKKAAQKIQHLAHFDALTDLANRLLFKERLQHAIAHSNRTRMPLFVLFVDLNRFKYINDTCGHNAGDQVLRECARRLRDCMRDSDTIARSGGDEFLILIESYAGLRDISAVAQKILAAMEKPFHVDRKEFEIGASIGISTGPDDGTDVETLIKHADIAMYRAKMERKSHFCFYSPSMTRQSLERYAMESTLRHALERGEMELYYQPKICLRTGRMSGAEALIRWHHPEYGLLLPNHFIYLAEEIGVIADMGLWAIREVCTRCRMWRQHGLPEIRIAINLAYPQFSNERLFGNIKQLLDEADLPPSVLELEITETMVMENAEKLMHSLQQLKQYGVHLSIDDFGTGYSSLAYLKRLPVDSVKVDRSFIKDLPADAEDAAITRAVLALVHSLKKLVVAEGVETKEQLTFLIENGCDEGQGFYFSNALQETEFRQFLAEEKQFVL